MGVVQVVVQEEQAEEPARAHHRRLRRIVDGEMLHERTQQREGRADVAGAQHVVRGRDTGDADGQHQDGGGGDGMAAGLPGCHPPSWRHTELRMPKRNGMGERADDHPPGEGAEQPPITASQAAGSGPRFGAHVERLGVVAGNGQLSGVVAKVCGAVALVGKPERQRRRRCCIVQPPVPRGMTVDRFVLQGAVPRGDESEREDEDRPREPLVAEDQREPGDVDADSHGHGRPLDLHWPCHHTSSQRRSPPV